MSDDPTDEVTDLLQHLIRNACFNDGTAESGFEGRSVDVDMLNLTASMAVSADDFLLHELP